MVAPWKKLSSEIAQTFRIFALRRERLLSPRTGQGVDAIVLESPDWVNVIALTPERQVVLIRQYRFGTEDVTLEIPGGIVDPGEDPLSAARRELLEETGFSATRWRALGTIAPNPAYMRNRLHCFLAEDCRLEREQRLDAGEDIAVELRALDQVDALLAEGAMTHALVAVAFQKLRLLGDGHTLA